MPVQIASQLLRVCGLPRLSYLTRTVYPSLLQSSAARFDRMSLDCYRTVHELTDKSRPTGRDAELSQEQVELQISLPIADGGMGMRPTTRITHAAYFSSATSVLPDFLRLFPNCIDTENTAINHEIVECRMELAQKGVGDGSKNDKQKKQRTPTKSRTPKKAQRRASAAEPDASRSNPQTESAPVADPAAAPARAHSCPDPTSPILLTLHSSIQQLWQQARKCALSKSSIQQQTFLNPQQLQHNITAQIEKRLSTQLRQSSTKRHQIVLKSLQPDDMSGCCHAFLTTLPSQFGYRLEDGAMRLAVRHRLGLLPFDELHAAACARCSHPTAFRDDPDHMHSCELHRRTLTTERHNNLVDVVMELARAVGFHVRREPRDNVRPEHIRTPYDKHYHDHADILLIKHAQRIYVDVTVSRPTCASLLRNGQMAAQHGHSMVGRSKAKHRKYDAIAKCNKYEFVTFAMETYGGLGDEARQLLRTLSRHSKDDLSQREFLAHAYRRLSVALQAGNANIQARGVHWMQVSNAESLLAMRAGINSADDLPQPGRSVTRSRSQPMRLSRLRLQSLRRRLFVQVDPHTSAAQNESATEGGVDAIAIAIDHSSSMYIADIHPTPPPALRPSSWYAELQVHLDDDEMQADTAAPGVVQPSRVVTTSEQRMRSLSE